MLKRIAKPNLITFLFVISSILSCEHMVDVEKTNSKFGIYFLKDSTIKIDDIIDVYIDKLNLKEEPWISEKDIEFYDWSSHYIYFRTNKTNFFPNIELYYQYSENLASKPFVIASGKQKCYLGYFSAIQSKTIPLAYIDEMAVGYYPSDILPIQWSFIFTEDLRNNETIKNTLKESGIYRRGINILLDSLWINNKDTTTITYNLKFKNHDIENLYVFDPLKCGEKVYSYFNIAPSIKSLSTGKIYNAKLQTKVDYTDTPIWNSNWYTLISSGEEIVRKIKLKGYEFLDVGDYLIEIPFSTPVRIDRNNRIIEDGKYWLGTTKTSANQFTINSVELNHKQLIKFIRR